MKKTTGLGAPYVAPRAELRRLYGLNILVNSSFWIDSEVEEGEDDAILDWE